MTHAAQRWKFCAVGALTAAVYLLTLIFYRHGPQSHSRVARELFAWFLVLSLLPLYWKGYRLAQGAGAAFGVHLVVGFSALFCLVALFIYPFHSTDVFGYINRGWQQVHYGLNPYVYRLADVPGWRKDPMLHEHWLYNPNPYGFLFSLLARAVCRAGSGDWWATLLLFKALNILALGACAWLVWSGAQRLGRARPLGPLYLLAWNPLVLMHHIANGHNDLLTGGFVAFAVYLALAGAELWVIPALVAATLLKYGPAVLIPFAFVFVVRRKGWRVALAGCLIGAALAALSAAPYLLDWEQLKLSEIRDNATLIDNSLHSLVIHIYGSVMRLVPALAPLHGIVNTIIKGALRFGFLAFLIYQLGRLRGPFPPEAFAKKSLLVLFVLICVVSSKFNAWYLGMLLPAALLIEVNSRLRLLVVVISCTELLSLTFFKQAYMLNYFALILVPAWLVLRRARTATEVASWPPAAFGPEPKASVVIGCDDD